MSYGVVVSWFGLMNGFLYLIMYWNIYDQLFTFSKFSGPTIAFLAFWLAKTLTMSQ